MQAAYSVGRQQRGRALSVANERQCCVLLKATVKYLPSSRRALQRCCFFATKLRCVNQPLHATAVIS